MTFSEALESVKKGSKICRSGWNGKGMYVVLQKSFPNEVTGIPKEESKHKFLPYLILKTADNRFVPWLISQTDVLADDWMTK